MPQIIFRKDSGELLFDTSKITFGLSKSGYMALNRNDGLYQINGANADPNQKSSYTYRANKYPIHGFTVDNAQSPIVFIVGRGCLIGTYRAGNSITFYYANASTSTKFFCFDLMRDTAGVGPYVKTYLDNGVCTFNSLMVPLNIYTSVAPPPPPTVQGADAYIYPYQGARYERISYGSWGANLPGPNLASIVDIPLSGGEFAAHLPFSRVARLADSSNLDGGAPAVIYTSIEGAYGRDGGISFVFAASTEGTLLQTPANSQNFYTQLPLDRVPVALVIQTANLPFPYSV